MKINEIRTLFSLDAKKFEQEIKSLDKLVNQFKKDFNASNKEITDVNKELKTMTSELKKIKSASKDVKDMVKNVEDLTKDFKSLTREMKDVKKLANDTKKSFKDMTKLDLSSIGKLQTMINSIKEVNLFKQSNLDRALQTAKQISSELRSAGLSVNIGSGGAGSSTNFNTTGMEQLLKSINGKMSALIAVAGAGAGGSLISAFKGNGGQSLGAIKQVTDEFEKQVKLNKELQSALDNQAEAQDKAMRMQEHINKLKEDEARTEDYAQRELLRRQLARRQDEQARHRQVMQNLDKEVAKARAAQSSNRNNLIQQPQGGSGVGLAGAAGGGAGMAGLAAIAPRIAAAMGPVGIALAAVTAGLVAMGAAIAGVVAATAPFITATDKFEKAIAKTAAATGLADGALQEFGQTLREGFGGQGYTTSVEEYNDALMKVYNTIGLTGDAAEGMTKKLLAVSQTTGYDAKEIVRAQDSLMKAFGMTGDQALDMITKLYQETGDKAGDLIDTLSEYPSQFQKAGLSAEWFYNLIKTGSEAGVFNTDKAADAYKELQLVITDKNPAVIEAFNKLGLSYDKVITGFNKGGKDAEDAIGSIAVAISKLSTKAEKQNVIKALFGAPGEDAGNEFFDLLASADMTVEDFIGTVAKAQEKLEETFGYQLDQAKNNVLVLKDAIGSQLAPVVTGVLKSFNDNIEVIRDAIEQKAAPAFKYLFETIAWAFGLDKPKDFVKALGSMIGVVGWLVKAFAKVIIVFNMMWQAQKAWGIFMIGLIVNIGTAFAQLALIFPAIAEGLVRSFDNAFNILGIMINNIGAGIVNGLTWAAKAAANGFIKHAINPIIAAYNNTIGLLPNAPKLGKVGTFDTGSNPASYKSAGKDISGFFNAFTKDNKVAGVIKSIGNMRSSFNGWALDSFVNSSNKLTEGWDKLFTKLPAIKLPDIKGSADKGAPKSGSQNTKDISDYKGSNPTDTKGSGGKKETAAEKAAREKKEKQDHYKQMIELEKKFQAQKMAMEEAAFQQKLALMGDTKEALKAEIKFLDDEKKKYKLTADEKIEITQRQFELGLELRDKALEDERDRLDKEVEMLQDANNEKIKSYESYIREIDDKLEALDRKWDSEDKQQSVNDLKAELAKYAKATSAAGIAKRKELEKQIAEEEKEMARDKERQKLEDEKKAHEDSIYQLELKNDEIEENYSKLYDNLESLVNNKEGFLKAARESITNETNANIKAGLDQLVKDYEYAYSQISKYTLNSATMNSWMSQDGKDKVAEGKLTGDSDLITEGKAEQDAARGVTGTLEILKAINLWKRNGNKLEKVRVLKKGDRYKVYGYDAKFGGQWNVGAGQWVTNMPGYVNKYHTGGVVDGIKDKFGEISAKLLPGEVVLTNQKFNKLMDFINKFTPSMGLNPAFAGAPSSVINYNAPMVNIETVNNNSNADFRQLQQELNVMAENRRRATGARRI